MLKSNKRELEIFFIKSEINMSDNYKQATVEMLKREISSCRREIDSCRRLSTKLSFEQRDCLLTRKLRNQIHAAQRSIIDILAK